MLKLRVTTYSVINILIAAVWLINGLFCKVLNLVPRHQQIVAEILGPGHASLLTKLIGLSEIFMAVWIVSGYKAKMNAGLQVLIISMMNILEFILVPELLLWGRWNIVFAFFLITIIMINDFKLKGVPTT